MSSAEKMEEGVFWCHPSVLDEFARHFTTWEKVSGGMYGKVDYREFKVKVHYTYRGISRTLHSIDRVEVKVVCRYLGWKEKTHFYETECGRRFSISHARFGDFLCLLK